MTDHYRTAREALDVHAAAVAKLADEHAKADVQRNPRRIAELYDARNTALQLAKVHSHLAIAQAITDHGIGR
jgi:hypothetical protein